MDTFEFDDVLITPFIEILDTGFDKLVISVLVLASVFAVLDWLWGYMKDQIASDKIQLSKMISKLIRYGFTFGIIKGYTKFVIPTAYQLFSGIGNSFGEGFGENLKIQSVWNKGWEEVNKLFHLSGEMEGIWGIVYFLFGIVAFLCIIFIMATLTMSILSFHIVVRLAVIFLALLPIEILNDIGKKTLMAIVNSGTELMTCVAISSMCFSIIKNHPLPNTVGPDSNSPQVIGIWLCVWIVGTFLVYSHDRISSMIIMGQGGVSGSDFGRYSGGMAATTGALLGMGVATTSKVLGNTIKGTGKIGETFSNLLGYENNKVFDTIKKTGDVVEKAGNTIGRGIVKSGKGAGKAIETITGNFSPIETGISKIKNTMPNSINTSTKGSNKVEETMRNHSNLEKNKTQNEKVQPNTENNSKKENKQNLKDETFIDMEKNRERESKTYSDIKNENRNKKNEI